PPPQGGENGERLSQGMLIAVAPGYGPGWVRVGKPEEARAATIKLVKDDVPLAGRVVDLEGKPIAGASVRVLEMWVSQQEDLGPWVKHVQRRKEFHGASSPNLPFDASALDLAQTVRSDADGRFRLTGFGRERV